MQSLGLQGRHHSRPAFMWGSCKLRSAFLQNSALSTKPSPTPFWLFISFKLNEPIFYSLVLLSSESNWLPSDVFISDNAFSSSWISISLQNLPSLHYVHLFMFFACRWHWPETDLCAVCLRSLCPSSLLKWSPDYWPPSKLVWGGVEDCYLKTLIWS